MGATYPPIGPSARLFHFRGMVRGAAAAVAAMAALLCGPRAADGHGLMLDPISRNARDGITTPGGNMWFSHVSATQA